MLFSLKIFNEMKKIGIFYGSTTGVTAEVAKKLGEILGVDAEDIRDVASTAPSAVADYDILVLGTSTWGVGDLQDDWEDYINGLEVLDLKGKKIALFGCGDETMSDSFCGGVGRLYNRLQGTGAEFIAPYDTVGYDFSESEAVVDDGVAVGLLLDQVNHPDLTEARLKAWAELIK